jgi:HSP20 family protein
MTLVRWDPFRDLATFQNRLQRVLTDDSGSVEDRYGDWAPPVDIFERGDDLVIRAELPGLKTEEIDIRVENGNLVLHGERKHEKEIDDHKVHRLERVYGTFTRRFALPTSVDATKIGAIYKNGVLEVVLPKADEAKERRVEIKVA